MTRRFRVPAAIVVAVSAWLALAYFLRFRYIEADWLVAHCVASPADLVCWFREAMGKAMHFNLLGYASLALALPATLLPGRAGWALALPALVAAAGALVFYNATLGAVAAVLAVLRLARTGPARATPGPRPAPG